MSLVRAKASGYYINSILANREVIRNGYDEALLLDTEGYVSEGAGENVFIVRNGVLYTPDLASCLDGITHASVIEIARDQGLQVVEKRIPRDEMYCADEAFFTGTAAEVTPIRELDDRVIGNGEWANHGVAAGNVLRRGCRQIGTLRALADTRGPLNRHLPEPGAVVPFPTYLRHDTAMSGLLILGTPSHQREPRCARRAPTVEHQRTRRCLWQLDHVPCRHRRIDSRQPARKRPCRHLRGELVHVQTARFYRRPAELLCRYPP